MMNLVGQTIAGRFKIQKSLGTGPHGQVYRAYDERRFESVALKHLRDELRADVDLMRALRDVTTEMQALRHANLVHCLGLEQTRDHAFWLYPLVEGKDVRSWLRQRGEPLRFHHAMLVLRGAAAAVAYLHEQGFVHGSIKLSNVLLRQGGWVAITDAYVFAWLAARLAPKQQIDAPWSEAAAAHVKLEPRADIRGLAELVVAMVTGALPNQDQGVNLVKLSQNLSVPDYAGQVLISALGPDPSNHPGSVAELYQSLTNRTLADEYGPEPELAAEMDTGKGAEESVGGLYQAAARLAAFLEDTDAPEGGGHASARVEPEPSSPNSAEEEALVVAADQLLAAFAKKGEDDPPERMERAEPGAEIEKAEAIAAVDASDEPGDVVESERTQYSTSWRNLVQEAREINELLQRAGQELVDGQWDQAQETCREILRRAPNNAAAKTLAAEAKTAHSRAQLLARAEQAVAAGQVDAAREVLHDLLDLDATNQAARDMLASLSE